MQPVLTNDRMKRADRMTIESGTPSLVLMERAAEAVVAELLASFDLRRVLVVCGQGNNGGDGYAVADILRHQGIDVSVFAPCGTPQTPEAIHQAQRASDSGVSVTDHPDLATYSVIVDALFGIGFHPPLPEAAKRFFIAAHRAGVPVLAVDVPSGVGATDCDDAAPVADVTVTFAAAKPQHYLYPGAFHTGRLVVAEIGIATDTADIFVSTADDLRLIPPRRADADKGKFGKVLAVVGSADMPGAGYLAAKAAYRAGCGLVELFGDRTTTRTIGAMLPEAVLRPDAFSDPKKLLSRAASVHVVLAGCGLGITPTRKRAIGALVRQAAVPLVLDADALNLFGQDFPKADVPVVVTPHVGEFHRMTGLSVAEIKRDPIGHAREFARKTGYTVLLKDARSVITDGATAFINPTGNCGMATAGSGDVLAGIVAGLIAQGAKPFDAARLGAYLHGAAGDLAKQQRGEYGLMASDISQNAEILLDRLNEVLR